MLKTCTDGATLVRALTFLRLVLTFTEVTGSDMSYPACQRIGSVTSLWYMPIVASIATLAGSDSAAVR